MYLGDRNENISRWQLWTPLQYVKNIVIGPSGLYSISFNLMLSFLYLQQYSLQPSYTATVLSDHLITGTVTFTTPEDTVSMSFSWVSLLISRIQTFFFLSSLKLFMEVFGSSCFVLYSFFDNVYVSFHVTHFSYNYNDLQLHSSNTLIDLVQHPAYCLLPKLFALVGLSASRSPTFSSICPFQRLFSSIWLNVTSGYVKFRQDSSSGRPGKDSAVVIKISDGCYDKRSCCENDIKMAAMNTVCCFDKSAV